MGLRVLGAGLPRVPIRFGTRSSAPGTTMPAPRRELVPGAAFSVQEDPAPAQQVHQRAARRTRDRRFTHPGPPALVLRPPGRVDPGLPVVPDGLPMAFVSPPCPRRRRVEAQRLPADIAGITRHRPNHTAFGFRPRDRRLGPLRTSQSKLLHPGRLSVVPANRAGFCHGSSHGWPTQNAPSGTEGAFDLRFYSSGGGI